MTLEQQLTAIVDRAVQEALERHLPAILAQVEAPVDPDRTYSYAQAAEYLGVTESCIRERVKSGELEAIQLGKYKLIPHARIRDLIQRELTKARDTRDQAVLPADVDEEIAALLGEA